MERENLTTHTPRKAIGYRLPIDLLDAIRQHAAVDRRSANSEVEVLLRLAIETRARETSRFFG